MGRMFAFDPQQYAGKLAEHGWLHIRGGLSQEYYDLLVKQADEYLQTHRLKDFALGDKQQALYQFPESADYFQDLRDMVGAVAGLEADDLVLSERHFKAYDAQAAPRPLPHKDRFASQVSVGFSVHVPAGSTLVMYPWDDLGPNPFNSSAELRASLRPERLPENLLNGARRVEIQDRPGDVNIFWGNSIWHCRENPASTTMLYLKLNAFNCDPLGEDPRTPSCQSASRHLLATANGNFGDLIPMVGRRVDFIHRRFNHQWQEVAGVVLWNEKHVSIDDHEFHALQQMNGQRTVREVCNVLDCPETLGFAKMQRLAALGIVDLFPGQAGHEDGHAVAHDLAVAG